MQFISGIGPLAARYDGFLLDLWGVIHDGHALYPGVKETLIQLRKQSKHIIFVSNAPRRASRVVEVLERLGINDTLYDAVVSSGEAAHEILATYPVGRKYIYTGLPRDEDLLYDLNYQRVVNPKDAEFILNAGLATHESVVEEELALLKQCLQLDIPMICINPDIEVVRLNGQRIWCAGAVASAYEELGGRVSYYGKPYSDIYRLCLEKLKMIDGHRILAVGDNIETDIAGGLRMGLPTTLVVGGILKPALNIKDWNADAQDTVRTHCEKHKTVPNYVIPGFTW